MENMSLNSAFRGLGGLFKEIKKTRGMPQGTSKQFSDKEFSDFLNTERSSSVYREKPDTPNYDRFGNGRIDYSRPLEQPVSTQPSNPFDNNDQYQALMEYRRSISPNQEQMNRLNELRTAFEGTGGYKDYRINQMQQQMQQMRQQPRMGMGLGGMRPNGMGMFNRFGQMPMSNMRYNPYNQAPVRTNPNNYMGYGMMQTPQPQYQMPQPYQSPYQQTRPQPQQFSGYGVSQGMGGYGSYGGISNPYQPQQYGMQNQQFQRHGRMF